jgi:y4mF family transcriptional regulator
LPKPLLNFMMAVNGTSVPIREEPAVDRHRALARQVRQRRKSLKLTQADLADLAGCSARFVRAFEQGKQTVRLDKVLDLLEVLGLELVLRPRGRS